MLKKFVALTFCLTFLVPCVALAGQVKALKVTVLSTMLGKPCRWGVSRGNFGDALSNGELA